MTTTDSTATRPHHSRLYWALVVAFYFVVLVTLPVVLSLAGCAAN